MQNMYFNGMKRMKMRIIKNNKWMEWLLRKWKGRSETKKIIIYFFLGRWRFEHISGKRKSKGAGTTEIRGKCVTNGAGRGERSGSKASSKAYFVLLILFQEKKRKEDSAEVEVRRVLKASASYLWSYWDIGEIISWESLGKCGNHTMIKITEDKVRQKNLK
jgi:hypothetical protein